MTPAIGLGHFLTVAAILFTIGVFGIFLNRKNIIIILIVCFTFVMTNFPRPPFLEVLDALF